MLLSHRRSALWRLSNQGEIQHALPFCNFWTAAGSWRYYSAQRWPRWAYTALTSALESQSVRNHIIIIITNTHSPPTGAWTTHWKCVQTAGRVGRDMSQPAAYITVVEKKSFARGALVEREIHRAVLFESWSKWKLRWVVLQKKAWLNLIICQKRPNFPSSRLNNIYFSHERCWYRIRNAAVCVRTNSCRCVSVGRDIALHNTFDLF